MPEVDALLLATSYLDSRMPVRSSSRLQRSQQNSSNRDVPHSQGLSAADTLSSEEDDDDMDFESMTDGTEDETLSEESEEDAILEFQDAEDGLNEVEAEIPIEAFEIMEEGEGEGDQDTLTEQAENTSPQSGRRLARISREFIQLLQQRGFQLRFEADDEEDQPSTRPKTRSQKAATYKAPPIPNELGRKLMQSGTFGSARCARAAFNSRPADLAGRLAYRETGLNRNLQQSATDIAQGLIPSSKADKIVHYSSRCYSGQFSDDGNFFFCCAQDFKVRMYDTSNPYDWKYYKTVIYPYGQWTITDASLSPDNRYLAYSSIRSTVCMSPTDPLNQGAPWLLDLADDGDGSSRGWRHGWHGISHFGIWSVRFSGDGRELVAGTSGPSVCVYDIERRRSIINIKGGHSEDVNAVCFGDKSSPHVLYSGSDDTLIKVWDRRSLGDGRAAGVFFGHTEGLTYVDSKGDGRYVLSNGKDQTMKLWDLRKMTSTEDASRIDPEEFTTGFDYRFMSRVPNKYRPHPHDSSVVTYRGHSVLKTLIRCHFSPPGSTNSRYVYTGSEDGSVYIYNIDATLAGKVDVNEGTRHSRPCDPDGVDQYAMDDHRDRNAWKTCVRDASWHPNAPMIAATSWNGWGMSTGTCSTHSWNDGSENDEGMPLMGQSVDQRLVPDKTEDEQLQGGARSTAGRRTRQRSRRVLAQDEDDEGDAW